MKRLISTLLATAALSAYLAVPATALSFADSQGHWAEAAIDTVSNLGIFQGNDGLFRPDDTMTRGMFITVLARLAEHQGLTVDSEGTTDFTDIPADAYYRDYAVWASENQIVTGISQTQFAPDAAVTRQQMCAILLRFFQWAEVDVSVEGDSAITFLDEGDISDYALEATAVAQGLGLIQGISVAGGVAFQPQESATRSAVATVFVRLMDYLEGEEAYSWEERQAEAEIAGYLSNLIANYNASTYLSTTDQLVQETMATLMVCLEQALEARAEGEFLTRAFVQTQYGETIGEMKELYNQLTEVQYNQFFNVVVRLGSTDEIYQVMDFFGVSYLG